MIDLLCARFPTTVAMYSKQSSRQTLLFFQHLLQAWKFGIVVDLGAALDREKLKMERRCTFVPLKMGEDSYQVQLCQRYLSQEKDPEGFFVQHINDHVGKGVFVTNNFRTGDFLMEYHGELITSKEACKREKKYPLKLGSYLFFFKYKRKDLCIDATFSKQIGRFINDGIGREKNARVRVMLVADVPHLAVFAIKNILEGEEIRIDYGVSNLPWRITEHAQLNNQAADQVCKCSKAESIKSGLKQTVLKAEKLMNAKTKCFSETEQTHNGIKQCSVVLEEMKPYKLLGTGVNGDIKHDSKCSSHGNTLPRQVVHARCLGSQYARGRICTPRRKFGTQEGHMRKGVKNQTAQTSENTKEILGKAQQAKQITDGREKICITEAEDSDFVQIKESLRPPQLESSKKSVSKTQDRSDIEGNRTVVSGTMQPLVQKVGAEQTSSILISEPPSLMLPPTVQPKTTKYGRSVPPEKYSLSKASLSTEVQNTSNEIKTSYGGKSKLKGTGVNGDIKHDSKCSSHGNILPRQVVHARCLGSQYARGRICTPRRKFGTQEDHMRKGVKNQTAQTSENTKEIPGKAQQAKQITDGREKICITEAEDSDFEEIKESLRPPQLESSKKSVSKTQDRSDIEGNRTVVSGTMQPLVQKVGAEQTSSILISEPPSLMLPPTVQPKTTKYDRSVPPEKYSLSKASLSTEVQNTSNEIKTSYGGKSKLKGTGVNGDIKHDSKCSSDGNTLPRQVVHARCLGSRYARGRICTPRRKFGTQEGHMRKGVKNQTAQTSENTKEIPGKAQQAKQITDGREKICITEAEDSDFVQIKESLRPPQLESSKKSVSKTQDRSDIEGNRTVVSGTMQPLVQKVGAEQTSSILISELPSLMLPPTVQPKTTKYDRSVPPKKYSLSSNASTGSSLKNIVLPFKRCYEGNKEFDTTECQTLTKNTSTKKPYRPCPYCSVFQSKLRSHLERKHKTEKEVQNALLLPKHERDEAFDFLKKKGIMKTNLEKMRNVKEKSQVELLRERSQGKHELVYCSKCYGFISKRFFYRHKRQCNMNRNSTKIPVSMPSTVYSNPEQSNEFEEDILRSFYNDDVGKICSTDQFIIGFGRREYLKVKLHIDKKDERRTCLKTEMRRLGAVYLKFKHICKNENIECKTALEMFNRTNFKILERAIIDLTTKTDGTIINGQKLSYGYMIKKVTKYIHGEYLIQKEDDKAAEINRFLDVLNYHWLTIFGNAEYSVKMKRQTNLRKPKKLPSEEDVKKLRDFTVSKISEIVEDNYKFISNEEFILLRDLLVCRLTLFNARRGGEPSRLRLFEWEEAENNVWYKDVEKVDDPLDKILLGRYKVAYQPGKNGKLVPLLIIDDCQKAIRVLIDQEVRKQVGIHPKNDFVFPYSQLSLKHVIGWHCVNRCCSLANLDKNITATNMRHHVATLYAGQDVPEDERQMFYAHMGHSAEINLNVYQSPLAVKEVTVVGKFFDKLDRGGAENSDNGKQKTPEDQTSSTGTRKRKLQMDDDLPNLRSNLENEDSGEPKNHISATTIQKKKLQENVYGEDIEDATDDSDSDYLPLVKDTSSESESGQDLVNVCSVSSPKKKRVYNVWSAEDSKLVKDFFNEYIYNVEDINSNKGHLPGAACIETFLRLHPKILPEEDMRQKVSRLKSKIFNERKLAREKIRRSSR